MTEAQNTVHNFVISRFRRAQSQALRQNVLESAIKGVGPKTVAKLYQAFHNLAAMKAASVDQITDVVHNATVAQQIYQFLHRSVATG